MGLSGDARRCRRAVGLLAAAVFTCSEVALAGATNFSIRLLDTLVACLDADANQTTLAEKLKSLGWRYPVQPKDQMAYWSLALGFDVGHKTVVSKDNHFPGVFVSDTEKHVITVTWEDHLSPKYTLVFCSMVTTSELDAIAELERSGRTPQRILETKAGWIADYGTSSLTVTSPLQGSDKFLKIHTIANVSKED